MQDRGRAFPSDLAVVYEAIEYAIIRVHYRYKLFKQLYGNQEAVDSLNLAVPELFREVREMLFENLLMGISQLTDPSSSKGPKGTTRENLTIRRLVETIDGYEAGLSVKLGFPLVARDCCTTEAARLLFGEDTTVFLSRRLPIEPSPWTTFHASAA